MIALFLLTTLAFGDAINGPPEDCPFGAEGQSSHAGEWCQPATCPTEGCPEGQRCEEVGLCVREEERDCGGNRPEDQPCTFTMREALGPCETQADCEVGTCEIADRCVPGSGCGCQAPVTPAGAGFGGVVLLSALTLRRRSR